MWGRGRDLQLFFVLFKKLALARFNILVPPTRDFEPGPHAFRAQSLNTWMARKPSSFLLQLGSAGSPCCTS